jgi:exoribonuclease R
LAKDCRVLLTVLGAYDMACHIHLDKKSLFSVWKGLYPIGAIIGVHKSSENQRSGLKILEIQHAVRKLYTLETVEAVGCLSEIIIQEKMTENRLDLTNLKVFTIDPPNSKDLDDAGFIFIT